MIYNIVIYLKTNYIFFHAIIKLKIIGQYGCTIEDSLSVQAEWRGRMQ
ncbi:MAG: hypothetical protein KGD68_07130 [Candidatus Lokiarchaeota archaeon]|nr:hypothetical protein [Candidatus Lokiarchaeota archaeon]